MKKIFAAIAFTIAATSAQAQSPSDYAKNWIDMNKDYLNLSCSVSKTDVVSVSATLVVTRTQCAEGDVVFVGTKQGEARAVTTGIICSRKDAGDEFDRKSWKSSFDFLEIEACS